MSTATTTIGWKNYKVGTIVTIRDGRRFSIVEITSIRTQRGYDSRRFTLSPYGVGRQVYKTSRAITYWINGIEDDAGQPIVVEPAVVEPAVVEPVAVVAPEPEPEPEPEPAGRIQHEYFPALLRIIAARRNAWLCGPAGSGKTTSAHEVAQALGLKFFAKSVGPQVTESSLLGYQDANGNTVRTQLREAFEHGGVFLLDEVDAASPAVLVVINALLANGHASFPDGVIDRHPDFVLVAGANTLGLGADRQYVGRQQIDAATLDRFVVLDWPYDPRIEAAAAGVPQAAVAKAASPSPYLFEPEAGCEARCFLYVQEVVALRNAVATFGKSVRVIISPRASIHGTSLIRQGFGVEDTLNLCVWKGLDTDTRKKIEAAC